MLAKVGRAMQAACAVRRIRASCPQYGRRAKRLDWIAGGHAPPAASATSRHILLRGARRWAAPDRPFDLRRGQAI